jgi:squalene synthase HpnC
VLDTPASERVHLVTTRSLSYTPTDPAPLSAAMIPPRASPPGPPSEAEILGRAGGENFRVASRVLPRRFREHLLAFYAYARLVDEIGDAYQGDRLSALDWVDSQVAAAFDGAAPGAYPLITRAVGAARELGLDSAPLRQLVEANRRDQTTGSYETFDDLLEYCSLSANPVGTLVLAAFGAASPERQPLADSICTGLQLAEHLQDVAEDAAAGRVYLPVEDMQRFGVSVDDLLAPVPASTHLRALMIFEVQRARRTLDDGRPLIGTLRGPARWAVACFWAGGQGALDAIAGRHFDPLSGAPRPSKARVFARAIAALRRSPTRSEDS